MIHFAVQAHPARTLMAESLAQEMGGVAVYDPEPDAPIKSPWRTLRHVLETRPPEATSLVVVQDDVTLCPGFRDAAHAAVEARSDRLILFFVAGRPENQARAIFDACSRDEPWAELPHAHYLNTVAMCWPVAMIQPMLAFIDEQRWHDTFSADDERICRWVRYAGVQACATVPSLAEHRDMTISLVGRRTMFGNDPARSAACFIGTDCGDCAVQIDWKK